MVSILHAYINNSWVTSTLHATSSPSTALFIFLLPGNHVTKRSGYGLSTAVATLKGLLAATHSGSLPLCGLWNPRPGNTYVPLDLRSKLMLLTDASFHEPLHEWHEVSGTKQSGKDLWHRLHEPAIDTLWQSRKVHWPKMHPANFPPRHHLSRPHAKRSWAVLSQLPEGKQS